MTESKAAEVIVEARDLDTDERKSVVLAAVRPATPGARERELKALINSVHPEAAFRSFARDVATALGPQHLIVAHYVGVDDQVLPDSALKQQPTAQGELFAA